MVNNNNRCVRSPAEVALELVTKEKNNLENMLTDLCEKLTAHPEIMETIEPSVRLLNWWEAQLDRKEKARKLAEREKLRQEKDELESRLARVKELLSNE